MGGMSRDVSLRGWSDKGGYHSQFNEPVAGRMSDFVVIVGWNSYIACTSVRQVYWGVWNNINRKFKDNKPEVEGFNRESYMSQRHSVASADLSRLNTPPSTLCPPPSPSPFVFSFHTSVTSLTWSKVKQIFLHWQTWVHSRNSNINDNA
jgi:hypothetical protein